MSKSSLLVIAGLLAGCASEPIVMPIDEGTYLASQEHTVSLSRTEAATREEAAVFCESKGQHFQVPETTSVPPSMGQFAASSIRFQCLDRQ